MTARYIVGDTRTVLRALPDASVDLVLSSPPFLALRSYLPADDPAKPLEMGSEPTPADFLDGMLDVVEECRRVLAPHGTLAFEFGDTYAGAGSIEPGEARRGQVAGDVGFRSPWKGRRNGWPLDKSLCFIPQLFGASLAYGRNLLNGRPIEPWRVRNVVRWVRPNPPVGALGDKFRPATSEMTIACMARDRWFDLDAVRTPGNPANERGTLAAAGKSDRQTLRTENPAGTPPLDWWEIPPQKYMGSHYATWPEALCVRPILAMCPQKVCTTCGQPSRRIVEQTEEYAEFRSQMSSGLGKVTKWDAHVGRHTLTGSAGADSPARGEKYRTVGWTDCGCPGGDARWRRGIVLDPFAGSGTTLAVAEGLGRDSIGIDLDCRNVDLARERVGLWLQVEHAEVAA